MAILLQRWTSEHWTIITLAAALIVVLNGEGGRADRMWVWLKLPNPENRF
jgi:hypothetical protein